MVFGDVGRSLRLLLVRLLRMPALVVARLLALRGRLLRLLRLLLVLVLVVVLVRPPPVNLFVAYLEEEEEEDEIEDKE